MTDRAVRQIVVSHLDNFSIETVPDATPLLALGLESLSILQIHEALQSSFPDFQHNIATLSHLTIAQIEQAATLTTIRSYEDMIEIYSREMPNDE